MKQGELEQLAIPVQQSMLTLEKRIMADIIRRIQINGEITAAADWQINRLRQLGVSKKEVRKAVGEALGLSKAELKKLYHDTLYNEYVRNQAIYKEEGHEWIPFEKNQELQDLITATEKQANAELKNITQSLGFAIRGPDGKIVHSPLLNFYQGTLDDAMMDIASGAFDYNTVIKRTIQTMTNSGLRSIDYGSGWSNRVEVAGRRAVMTGFSQLQAKINEKVAKDLDTDYFEVSWHGGARPEHQVWQGRVYTKRQLEVVCGLGSVTGLCGANCYHQYNAFIPGISVRTYTDQQLDEMNARENEPKNFNGKKLTTYEALQQQRKMETLMRKQRQDIHLLQVGKADADDLIAAKVRYRITMGQYVEFSKGVGLPQQRERIYMDGLGRMVTGKEPREEKRKYVGKQIGKLKKQAENPLEKTEIEKIGIFKRNRLKTTAKETAVNINNDFVPAKSLQEAKEYALKELSVLIKGAEEMPLENINSLNRHYGQLLKENFHMKGFIQEFEFTDALEEGVYAARSLAFGGDGRVRRSIQLNKSDYKDIGSLSEKYSTLVQSGHFPRGTTYENIIDHEFAHAMADEIGLRMSHIDINERFTADEWKTIRVAGKAFSKIRVEETAKKLRITPGKLQKKISGYATTEYSETFAEAFSSTRGSEPTKEALALMNEYDRIKKMYH